MNRTDADKRYELQVIDEENDSVEHLSFVDPDYAKERKEELEAEGLKVEMTEHDLVLNLTFKTPDVVYDALRDMGFDDDAFEYVSERLTKWIKWDEYVTIKINLTNDTIEVEEN